MADRENLLPGDAVDWVRGDELINATVLYKGPKLIGIKVERDGASFLRHVAPEALRLRYGGKKRLAILNSARNTIQ
jgi:hypothetical protein